MVPFTVTVPPASPPGDHPAAVVATEAGREVGVRVHLRVGGPALAALTVEDVAVRGRGAGRVVSYTLVNRGNVTLAPRLAIRAEGRFGEVAGRAPRAVPVELLPGRRVTLTEPWPGAPVLDRVELTLTVTAPRRCPGHGRRLGVVPAQGGSPAARAPGCSPSAGRSRPRWSSYGSGAPGARGASRPTRAHPRPYGPQHRTTS
ncbi:hypothetical protein GCM10020254_51240 [Streptomyces goshikiensis]